MWATFADMATPHAIRVDGDLAGYCSVNEVGELLAFHLRPASQHRAEHVLGLLIDRLELNAAMPSTVDPGFLSVVLAAGGEVATRALLYHHWLEPQGDPLSEIRTATVDDHEAAVRFGEEAAGMPRAFLEPYYDDRIGKGELYLHEVNGEIRAVGECRADVRQAGHAHLGLIVGRAERGRGLGGRLMHALVLECRRQGWRPLCSTEPENLAAQHLIQRAGFRALHRLFRVSLR